MLEGLTEPGDRVNEWVLAILAMLAAKWRLRVAPGGSDPGFAAVDAVAGPGRTPSHRPE